ncbi:MAPEG family protein [Photobacterium atrarenae]|uniref:MAPEG family protein n=1 Tax=Photobacterium atrarenae TaxID=865757 RepID=A0ABY5GCL8_9GAMM|nr:MAPEG family protein [Photobacterium atrarenae]UTV26454.1 MAPEG family protein [Photobacterium atrarenae]
MAYLVDYQITVMVVGFVGLLMFIQLLMADVIALKQKHVPGYPVEHNHDHLLFRATRAHLNMNESVAIFITFVIFALLSQASPNVVNMSALVYLVSRIAHMTFYYLDIKLARSIAFGLSLFSLVAVFMAGIMRWL